MLSERVNKLLMKVEKDILYMAELHNENEIGIDMEYLAMIGFLATMEKRVGDVETENKVFSILKVLENSEADIPKFSGLLYNALIVCKDDNIFKINDMRFQRYKRILKKYRQASRTFKFLIDSEFFEINKIPEFELPVFSDDYVINEIDVHIMMDCIKLINYITPPVMFGGICDNVLSIRNAVEVYKIKRKEII